MKIIKKSTKTDILVSQNGMKTLVCGTKPMNFTPQTFFSKNLATGSVAGYYFQDPVPAAAGYYAETGTGSASCNLLPPPTPLH